MNSLFKRVIWIVIDSVGIGELPDADRFGDLGADTLGHIMNLKGLEVPNMERLGLKNIVGTSIFNDQCIPIGVYGKAKEISEGKDTTIGHWEMIGVSMKEAFPTYPEGFPDEIIEQFVKECHIPGVLGNCTASGTEIIKKYGKEHIETKKPIVYTSADSVFQIASHETVYSPEELYKMCEKARKILTGKDAVARVIARPFKGDFPYERTANRRDFSLRPDDNNILVKLKNKGFDVAAVGKIEDIFAGSGITRSVHTKDNEDGMDKTFEYMNTISLGLIFTNLVEFDSKWGHRRDADGYKAGLEAFDKRLGQLMKEISEDDLIIVNADHGCDPTFKGTDHTREYIPVLIYSKKFKKSVDLGILDSFADIGATIGENFDLSPIPVGSSFFLKLKEACDEYI